MTHVEQAVAGPPRAQVQVVPLRGLPVVAAVVVFVIVSIAGNWLWALTFCHVVGGALWTAIDLFVGLIVGPILARLTISARAEFSARFITVLVEMRKQQPDGAVIALLMRRFVYTSGIIGLMQVATLIIMTRVATQ